MPRLRCWAHSPATVGPGNGAWPVRNSAPKEFAQGLRQSSRLASESFRLINPTVAHRSALISSAVPS
jgi:hypothetical protein